MDRQAQVAYFVHLVCLGFVMSSLSCQSLQEDKYLFTGRSDLLVHFIFVSQIDAWQ